MSSEQQGRENPPDLAWSKTPENNADPASESETNRTTDAGSVFVTNHDAPTETLAILPVRGIVLFPGMVVPLTIGRPAQ